MTFRFLKHIAIGLSYALITLTLVVIAGAIYLLDNRPDLKPWHTAKLNAEFTAGGGIDNFDDYLVQENLLFDQLDSLVYTEIDSTDKSQTNRFYQHSASTPGRWPRNWNRSFELPALRPRAGVLLLHGMSDSPYSLRQLGEQLSRNGAWVVGLRLPGHGTAPAGLSEATWQDMSAAAHLAVDHLHQQIDGAPLYIIGYSTGAPLAIDYALHALAEPDLPQASGLVLISPAIGLTPLAALARWQERLGNLLGFEKFAWNSIDLEYDPFKYNSFALNAAIQVYDLTNSVRSRVALAAQQGALGDFPPVLAFQSVVDATVSAPAVVDGLFSHLSGTSSELVLFGLNRSSDIEPFLISDPAKWIARAQTENGNYAITLITNENDQSAGVVSQHKPAHGSLQTDCSLGMSWPDEVYSLAHVSLPFPPNDPLYGGSEADASPGIQLGNIAFRGERNVLRVSAADMLRQRWNPFYDYMSARIQYFMGVLEADRVLCKPV